MEWEKDAIRYMKGKMIKSYLAYIAVVLMFASLVVATKYEGRLEVVRLGLLVAGFVFSVTLLKIIRKMSKEYEIALKDIIRHSYNKKCYDIDEILQKYGFPEYIDNKETQGYGEVYLTSNGVCAGIRFVDKDEAYLLKREYGQIKKERDIDVLNYTYKKKGE